MSQDEKLLNCPFCGAFPENVFGTIMCNYCGVKIEGVDKWNRRPSSGSPLPVELDERELFNIINNQTFDLTKQGNCLGHENSWALAKAICSRFSQKKVTNLEGETK